MKKSLNLEEMKSAVVTQLIKYGNNPDDSKEMVNEHFDYVIRTYGIETSIKKMAEIISIIR